MKRSSLCVLGALLAVASPSGSCAAVYLGSGNVGSSGSYNLSITTDDTIGILNNANILAYSITISDGINTINLNPPNSDVLIAGNGLTASATDISFNFSVFGLALFQSPTTGSGGPFLCFQGTGCHGGDPGIGLAPISGGSIQASARQGTQIVASVVSVPGGVPEPATWAMMLVGFGAMGVSFRRRRVGISPPQVA